MRCPKCNAEEAPDAIHCTECGALLSESEAEPVAGPEAGGNQKILAGMVKGDLDTSTSDSHDDNSQVHVTDSHEDHSQVHVSDSHDKHSEVHITESPDYSRTKVEETKIGTQVNVQGLGIAAAAVLVLVIAAVTWGLRPGGHALPPSSTTTRPTTVAPATSTTTVPAGTSTPGNVEVNININLPEPESVKVPEVSSAVEAALRIAYTSKLEDATPSAAIEVTVQRPGADTWRPLRNGEELSSADKYRVRLEPEGEAHFYVFQIDTTGKLDWIFPKNSFEYSFGANPAPAGRLTQIPDGDQAFFLDENLGVEHLYVAATRQRWDALENALEAARKSRSGGMKIESSFGRATRGIRGVGGVRPSPGSADAGSATSGQKVKGLIKGKFGVLVEERWFFHVAPPVSK